MDSGDTISKNAGDNFSNSRLVLANFENAQRLILSMLDNWITQKLFVQQRFHTVIQQMEKLEDGLSQVERRALIELSEFAGAKKVAVIEHSRKLTHNEALSELIDQ